MTVFPPSIHPMGEAIEFAEFGDAGNATRAGLMDSLTSMSICGIVVPLYQEGKRNDIVLALSGTLLSVASRSKWCSDLLKSYVR